MRSNAGLVLLLGTLACADGHAKAAEHAATQTAADSAAPQDSTASPSRPLHLARLEERAPSSFPHAPHLRFDCSRCHARVAGHERHANVPCRQCHEAPAPTPARASAPDCNGCHHAANRTAGCRHCHERAAASPPPALAVSVEFRIAGHSAARTVSFPHARHAPLECTRCHTRLTGAHRPAAAQQCGSCHERHHQPAANCAACHQPPRPGVHDLAVHRGCGGSGCHQDAAVLALPFTRSLCLTCHPAQAAHEPGGDCAGCHGLRRTALAAAPGSNS